MKSSLLVLLLPVLFGMRATPAPENDALPLINQCKTITGKQKDNFCEFEILTLWFMGKNGEVLGSITPTNKTIKLPQSKAVSTSGTPNLGSLIYNVSIDFRRINVPTFATSFYTLSKASITDPISPGETTAINTSVKVSPNMPSAGLRPNRVMFPVQLNYSKGQGESQPTLNFPIQLVQIENPVAFAQLPKEINHYRDRAEAWITFTTSVDFTK